jgi:hypothetical protein
MSVTNAEVRNNQRIRVVRDALVEMSARQAARSLARA